MSSVAALSDKRNGLVPNVVNLGPYLGVVVRRQDAVCAGTALRMAPKGESDQVATEKFRQGLIEYRAIKEARWFFDHGLPCNQQGLNNCRSQQSAIAV